MIYFESKGDWEKKSDIAKISKLIDTSHTKRKIKNDFFEGFFIQLVLLFLIVVAFNKIDVLRKTLYQIYG